jgi:hypothetical protein
MRELMLNSPLTPFVASPDNREPATFTSRMESHNRNLELNTSQTPLISPIYDMLECHNIVVV